MDAQSFDRLTTTLARRPNRRKALGLIAAGVFAGLLSKRATPALALDRPDFDGDGLYDDDETDVYGTDQYIYDTDGDGVGDGEEVYYGTDPLTAPSGGGTTGGGDTTGGGQPTGGGLNERPGANGCNIGLTECSGFCVDVTNDFYNCGMCSNRCLGRDGGYCEANFCVYPCIAAGTC